MGARTLARQRALQLLFALEAGAEEDLPFAVAERRFMAVDARHREGWGPFARALATVTWEERDRLDPEIAGALTGWTLERLPLLDKLCLRMGLSEMRHFPEIPVRVTLNEYIELARHFSTDESPQFVNAVLDRLAREFQHKDFKSGEEPRGEIDAADRGELQFEAEEEDANDDQPAG